MERKIVMCLNCGKEFTFESASNDGLGWHTTCPECKGSFDIDIQSYLLPNGTKIRLADATIGIIDGNDAETTDEYKNINYYVCPMEFTHLEIWSNHYVMVIVSETEIVEQQ